MISSIKLCLNKSNDCVARIIKTNILSSCKKIIILKQNGNLEK